jgi:hypothetical protein
MAERVIRESSRQRWWSRRRRTRHHYDYQTNFTCFSHIPLKSTATLIMAAYPELRIAVAGFIAALGNQVKVMIGAV